MDSTEKAALWVAAGVAAYLVYQSMKKTPQTVVAQTFKNAGTETWKGTYNPESVMVNAKDSLLSGTTTTYRFNEGDYDKLNVAQRILINLDSVVPGTLLTQLALKPWRD